MKGWSIAYRKYKITLMFDTQRRVVCPTCGKIAWSVSGWPPGWFLGGAYGQAYCSLECTR